MQIIEVAIPCPLRRSFDYLPPTNIAQRQAIQPGMRVLAPFGPRRVVGVVVTLKQHSQFDNTQLKPLLSLLDDKPTLSNTILELCRWASNYYHHPIGDCLNQALPTQLRKPSKRDKQTIRELHITEDGRSIDHAQLKRSPKQAALLALLTKKNLSETHAKAEGFSQTVISALIEKKLITIIEVTPDDAKPLSQQQDSDTDSDTSVELGETPLTLNQEQSLAADSIIQTLGQYRCHLLDGVTGSGKTEVYLHAIHACLSRNEQILVMIPEINLTPQTLGRFQKRFKSTTGILHSNLTHKQRYDIWQATRNTEIKILIGTRSAVFSDIPKLGLIIIDEEHDSSFKQQEGWRYSARDLCIKRAADAKIPVVLGSATPSLESLYAAHSGRYQHLLLLKRAGDATPPQIELLDIKNTSLDQGFSVAALTAIRDEIARGNQALVFINRRGFSPALFCHDCGWAANCNNCDARLTVHLKAKQMRCHHCGDQQALVNRCSQCGSARLDMRGPGTERCEVMLKEAVPQAKIIRIDRDTTQRKNSLEALFNEVNSGEPCILVGTQMLAKGHHFPNVTLVVVIDFDGGLFSADFKGPEKTAQLLSQVSGRAGRASKPGKVIVQSYFPEHPLLQTLTQEGYQGLAKQLLTQRSELGLPPYSYMAIIRASANTPEATDNFLTSLKTNHCSAHIIGPLPSLIPRKNNRHHGLLIIHNKDRSILHQTLALLCSNADTTEKRNGLHWSVDVDPVQCA